MIQLHHWKVGSTDACILLPTCANGGCEGGTATAVGKCPLPSAVHGWRPAGSLHTWWRRGGKAQTVPALFPTTSQNHHNETALPQPAFGGCEPGVPAVRRNISAGCRARAWLAPVDS